MFSQFFQDGEDYFGSKPDVPRYPSSSEILAEMVSANKGALPGVTDLAGRMDTANFGLFENQLDRVAPSFMGSIGQTDKNIASRVRGEVPEEVQNAIQNSAAARSFLSGTGQGEDQTWLGNLTGRDLARTSYGIQREGEADLQRFGGVLKGLYPTTDVRKLLFSPGEVQNVMEQKWNEEWLRAKVAGAPDPVARGRADQEMALFATIMSAAGGGGGSTPQPHNPTQPWDTGRGGDLNYGSGGMPVYGSGGVDWNYNNFPTTTPNPTQAPPTTVESPWGEGLWA